MTVYKRYVDFEDAYVNKNFEYEIYGLTTRANAKVGDTLYLDVCGWKHEHTYIRGVVTKVLKTRIILKYEYIDYI